jgi:hypothetical protein
MDENKQRGEQTTERGLGSAGEAIEDLEPEQDDAAEVKGGFQGGGGPGGPWG